MATSAYSDYVAGPSRAKVDLEEPEALTRYSALALAFSIVGMSTDPEFAKKKKVTKEGPIYGVGICIIRKIIENVWTSGSPLQSLTFQHSDDPQCWRYKSLTLGT